MILEYTGVIPDFFYIKIGTGSVIIFRTKIIEILPYCKNFRGTYFRGLRFRNFSRTTCSEKIRGNLFSRIANF